IPLDPVYKDRLEGIWLLQQTGVAGTYSTSYPWAERLDQLATVRKCIRLIDSNYSGYKPGFSADERTWITTFGGGDMYARTRADACVTDDGDAFVVGFFSGDLYVSKKRSLSTNATDCFLSRLNADGTLAWVRALGSRDRFDAKPVAGINGSC